MGGGSRELGGKNKGERGKDLELRVKSSDPSKIADVSGIGRGRSKKFKKKKKKKVGDVTGAEGENVFIRAYEDGHALLMHREFERLGKTFPGRERHLNRKFTGGMEAPTRCFCLSSLGRTLKRKKRKKKASESAGQRCALR